MKAPVRRILVVEDDAAVAMVLMAQLKQVGHAVEHAPHGERALEVLEHHPVDLVITDLRMPGMDGMTLLRALGTRWPETPVVMITAHGTVPLAVEAMREGAVDFLLKPFDREELLFVLGRALAREPSPEEARAPRPAGAQLLGTAAPMREVLSLLQRAASGSATVLLRGESGTGKGLLAQALHSASPRGGGPLVKVVCGALPEELLESELFGYEKGAFTGANTQKPGRVELAEGGTLFLDEIGDISLGTQVKLLRLLQDREYERLGGTRTLKANVRFVAATHQPLEEKVRAGTFREDLFYRLNVVPLWVPPLRDRREDIPALVEQFVRELGVANARPRVRLAPAAITRLQAEAWPGNVRQLQNFIERLVVLADHDDVGLADVEKELERSRSMGGVSAPETRRGGVDATGRLDEQRAHAERAALEDALARSRQNRSLAARLLGISRRTLYNKLEEHGLVGK